MNTNTALKDRTHFTPRDIVYDIWSSLSLPASALSSLTLEDTSDEYASSFCLGDLAQSCIALSALSASLVDAACHGQPHGSGTISEPARVHIPRRHALAEFISERVYTLNGKMPAPEPGVLGGLKKTADADTDDENTTTRGYVRIHEGFPNHRSAAFDILGVESEETATREEVSEACARWKAQDLETVAAEQKAVIYALRSYAQWDATPQAAAVGDFPVVVRQFASAGLPGVSPWMVRMPEQADRCLRGVRVLEFTRVLAGPVAGRMLAAHGADVLWVTTAKLPSLPELDRDTGRGKRTIQLDLDDESDRETLRRLIAQADVFLQSYRPGALEKKGFGMEEVAKIRPGIVYANFSAWGDRGPWSQRRGFDSIVQTVTGMNVSEAEHAGDESPGRPTPCQALDHGGGYLLATGICAALYHRMEQGGSWEVQGCLAGVAKYLRSLGQRSGREGFVDDGVSRSQDFEDLLESRDSHEGQMRALRHAAQIEGKMPGWDRMLGPLGSDSAEWL